MSARIIVVSNRVAVPKSPRAPVAGGLAVAVKAVLKIVTGCGSAGVARPTISPTPNCKSSR